MPQDPASYEASTSPPFGNTVTKMRGDMKFVGLFTIITGALACLSIVGAIVGIPYIIMGLRLREAADAFDQFDALDDRDALRRAFRKQRTYFYINKIIIIISLVLLALYILAIIFLVGFGLFSDGFSSSY